MNINATIFGQMITFGIFVWVNMKFIWPKIKLALEERENKILNGLQAAAQGQQQLEQAKLVAQKTALETKIYCDQLINQSKQQAEQLLEQAILEAKQKSEEIIKNTQIDLYNQKIQLQKELQLYLADFIVNVVEKFLNSNINNEQHSKILNEINNRIYDA